MNYLYLRTQTCGQLRNLIEHLLLSLFQTHNFLYLYFFSIHMYALKTNPFLLDLLSHNALPIIANTQYIYFNYIFLKLASVDTYSVIRISSGFVENSVMEYSALYNIDIKLYKLQYLFSYHHHLTTKPISPTPGACKGSKPFLVTNFDISSYNTVLINKCIKTQVYFSFR